MTKIEISALTIDPDLQMRATGVDVGVATEYAEAMEAGVEFPAIIVFTDTISYWPADGFHRIEASKKAGRETILADIRQGTRRDAILYAVGVNASHGLHQRRQALLCVDHAPRSRLDSKPLRQFWNRSAVGDLTPPWSRRRRDNIRINLSTA